MQLEALDAQMAQKQAELQLLEHQVDGTNNTTYYLVLHLLPERSQDDSYTIRTLLL